MGPMARIWKVFLDECGSFDVEMIDDWRDALDVLLVFVSLTSQLHVITRTDYMIARLVCSRR